MGTASQMLAPEELRHKIPTDLITAVRRTGDVPRRCEVDDPAATLELLSHFATLGAEGIMSSPGRFISCSVTARRKTEGLCVSGWTVTSVVYTIPSRITVGATGRAPYIRNADARSGVCIKPLTSFAS